MDAEITSVDTSNGRVQLRTWSESSGGGTEHPPLVLLHPMPHDGSFFQAIAPLLAASRQVVAPDYPGYGGSDDLESTPTIDAYAEVLMEALDRSELNGPFDFFGFHTGCLVATEMSLSFAWNTRKVVQVDVPYFDPDTREKLLAGDSATGGFIAAFSYAGEDRYPGVIHSNLIIATNSSLAEPTRRAAGAIMGSRLLELPEVGAPALENGAKAISAATLTFLNN